jgi:hypothetical protein
MALPNAESRIPQSTPFGIIRGRDSFFLWEITHDYKTNTVTLSGELSTPGVAETAPYTCVFSGVLGLRMEELDFSSWGIEAQSCFDEIEHSHWIARMLERDSASKVSAQHHHYQLQTYDDVFDVVCWGYVLNFQ